MGLSIEVGYVHKRPSCEECVADVTDGALDSAFLVAAGYGDRPRLEAVIRGELKEPRIETDGVAVPLEHRALELS